MYGPAELRIRYDSFATKERICNLLMIMVTSFDHPKVIKELIRNLLMIMIPTLISEK